MNDRSKQSSVLRSSVRLGLLACCWVLATDLLYSHAVLPVPARLDARLVTLYLLVFAVVAAAAGIVGMVLRRLGTGVIAAAIGSGTSFLLVALRLHDLGDSGISLMLDGGLSVLALGTVACVAWLIHRIEDPASRRAAPTVLLAAHLPALVLTAKVLVDTVSIRIAHSVPLALAFIALWPLALAWGYGLMAGRWVRPARLVAASWVVPVAIISLYSVTGRATVIGGIDASAAAGQAGLPPIVWITVDTLRADHLSVYGHHRETTPNLEELARTATVYTQCVSQGNSTWQSTPSLLSGLTPYRHGGVSETRRLPETLLLLPERLQERGYQTIGQSANPWVSRRYGMAQGFEDFFLYNTDDELTLYDIVKVAARIAPWQVFRARDHLPPYASVPFGALVDDAGRMLSSRGTERPFFLYMQPIDPHGPYEPPVRYTPAAVRDLAERDFVSYWSLRTGVTVNDRRRQALMDLYDGEITYTDAQLGRFFNRLRQLDLFDRSLIIVTSDHGEQFQDHALWRHSNSLYQQLLHVPLIVKYPNQHAGSVVRQPVASIDIVPTVLRILGQDCQDCDGYPLQDAATGKRPPVISYLMARSEIRPVMSSVVADGWKLIRKNESGAWHEELFNLDKDPYEMRQALAAEPKIAARLRGYIESYEASAGPLPSAQPISLRSVDRQRLRALGYVQ